jgi:hypothetical protein
MKFTIAIQTCCLILGVSLLAKAQTTTVDNGSYKVETIALPKGLTGETGGVTFMPDGRLVACFIRGEVMTYEPKSKQWKVFATGLHEPLGIMAVSNSEVIVMQRPELTRIKDTDGDGVADLYENMADEFGLSRNYHEFAYGPVKDKEGNLYIALNTASPGGKVAPEIRGKYNPLGRDLKPGSMKCIQLYLIAVG